MMWEPLRKRERMAMIDSVNIKDQELAFQLVENEVQQKHLRYLSTLVETRLERAHLQSELDVLRYQHEVLSSRVPRHHDHFLEEDEDDYEISHMGLLSTLMAVSKRATLGELYQNYYYQPIKPTRAPPPPPLPPPEADKQKNLLETRASSWGFEIVPIKGDGACMFRAISHQLFGDESHHEFVRQQALQVITKDVDYYLADKTLEQREDYLQVMQQSDAWGDEAMLNACAQAFQLIIVLLHDFKSQAKPIRIEPRKQTKQVTTIYMGFYHEMHYVALI